ncbi:MAG: transketolase C-terminal domain-containing protein, partial [Hyphomicrobiales bacterium]
MRDSFIKALTQLAAADPMVTLITGDLGFGVLTDFAKRFPNQFINAGVAEQHMTGLACGMALEGHKVYTYSIGNFTTLRCLEQIRNDVCYHNCDVTVVSVGGGFSYGQLGVSHFATEDLAILRTLPNMKVVAPSDPWETSILTHQMAELNGPKYLRLDKGKAGLPEDPNSVQFGKARTIREGKDITLIAIGAILSEALSAATTLELEGFDPRVVVFNTAKPLDQDTILKAARETKGIVIVEEHIKIGGLASAIAECCMTNEVHPKAFRSIGVE